jgi:hypothetical protein
MPLASPGWSTKTNRTRSAAWRWSPHVLARRNVPIRIDVASKFLPQNEERFSLTGADSSQGFRRRGLVRRAASENALHSVKSPVTNQMVAACRSASPLVTSVPSNVHRRRSA